MRIRLPGWLIAFCAAGLAAAARPADDEWRVDYQLTFGQTESALPEATVLAVLTWNRDLGSPPAEVELRMRWDYPGGYAAHVRDFEAYVPAGSRSPQGVFEARVDAAEGRFTVPVLEDGTTGIRYRVPLEHAPEDGLGFDETPHAFEDGVFWNGRALFVHHPAARNTLTLSVPAGQRATVSFAASRQGVYQVGDSQRLCNSFLIVGRHLESSIELEGSELLLALGKPLAPEAEVLAETLERFFDQAARVFGGPSPARSVIALDLTAPDGTYDGAVYGNDAHIAYSGEIGADNAEAWRPILCHESLHLWSPTMVPLEDRQMWFSEGFTDYYAHLLLVRAGLYSGASFLEDVRGWVRDYLPEAGATGLWEAGRLGAKNRTLLYQGGALAALCLDIEIRHGSSNRASLDDVMAALYEACGGAGERSARTLRDLDGILEEIGGRGVGSFVERHVEGSEPLPLAGSLSKAGLDFSAEELRVPARDSLWRLIRCSGMVATGEGIRIQRSEGELRPEDFLIQAAGRSVGHYDELSAALAGRVPGDRVELVVLRGGERLELALTLGGDPAEIEWEDAVSIQLHPARKVPSKAGRVRAALFGPLD